MSTLTHDQIKGMLAGLTLGDAMGAPHEFVTYQPKYTGILQYPLDIPMRYGHKIEGPVGSVTDDSYMSLSLVQSLEKGKPYQYQNALSHYLNWANSKEEAGMKRIGTNTAALLRGVTTLQGYTNRFSKVTGLTFDPSRLDLLVPVDTASQSNGSLMRCAPLICRYLQDPSCIYTDCYLTNPNLVNFECSFLYMNAMRGVMANLSPLSIVDFLLTLAKQPGVVEALQEAKRVIQNENFVRNMSKPSKGWVVHPLYCAIAGLDKPTLSECLDWVIQHPGSDTDTNACIAGGLYGIKGWSKLDERAKMNYAKVRIPLLGLGNQENIFVLGEPGIETYVQKLI